MEPSKSKSKALLKKYKKKRKLALKIPIFFFCYSLTNAIKQALFWWLETFIIKYLTDANVCVKLIYVTDRKENVFMTNRTSGILMHITSLPGKFGIGTFGQSAYDFVDFLAETK